MIVDNQTTATKYTELFPEWTMLSATKFTKGAEETYKELLGEYERIVFWHPSRFIKDSSNARSRVLKAICAANPDKVEAYGYISDTVPQVMDYVRVLFPTKFVPIPQMQTHTDYDWRYSRRMKKKTQVPVTVFSTTPENIKLILDTINS